MRADQLDASILCSSMSLASLLGLIRGPKSVPGAFYLEIGNLSR